LESGSVQVQSLIGNPVQIGDGPAAVTLPILRMGTPLTFSATEGKAPGFWLEESTGGKAVNGVGESEDLPGHTAHHSRK